MKYVDVKFSKSQVAFLKQLLDRADDCASEYNRDESYIAFRGFLSSGLQNLFDTHKGILVVDDE